MRLPTVFWKAFLYLYGFLFIFNPGSLLRINLTYVLFPLSIIIILPRFKALYYLLIKKRVFLFILTNLFFIIYLLISYIFGSTDALSRSVSFLLVILNIFCATAMLFLYQRAYSNKITAQNLITFMVSLGTIQLFFVTLALIFPSFREWTLSNENLYELSNDLGSGLRSYGLATGYTSTFPMFMGLCSLFSIYLFSEHKKVLLKVYYLIITVLLVFSITLNARIGLVPIVVWLFLAPVYFIYKKRIGALLFLLLFSSTIIPYLVVKYSLLESQIFFRLNQGIEEVIQLFSGNITGTFEAISDMWFFPKNIVDFLLGQGKSIMGASPRSSDIGLVQDIFMFGLIPTLFLFLSLSYFLKPITKELFRKFGLVFILTFLVSLLTYYLKGVTFQANAVTNCLIFMSLAMIYSPKPLKPYI